MSAKVMPKTVACQGTVTKKRKSCFEITNVAFQTLSDEDSGEDDDVNLSSELTNHTTENDVCTNCNEILSELSKNDTKDEADDAQVKTRFKVLKSAQSIGKWNCIDFFEDDDLDFHSSIHDLEESENDVFSKEDVPVSEMVESISIQHDLGDGHLCDALKSNILSKNNAIYKISTTSNSSPDFYQFESDISLSQKNCSHSAVSCCSACQSLQPRPDEITSKKVLDLEANHFSIGETCNDLHENRQQSDSSLDFRHQVEFSDSEVNQQTSLKTNRDSLSSLSHAEQLCAQLNCLGGNLEGNSLHKKKNGFVSDENGSNHSISHESISNKISQALDLAKKHVILTANEEITRLKEQINILQTTVKHLEDENRQLRSYGTYSSSSNDIIEERVDLN